MCMNSSDVRSHGISSNTLRKSPRSTRKPRSSTLLHCDRCGRSSSAYIRFYSIVGPWNTLYDLQNREHLASDIF